MIRLQDGLPSRHLRPWKVKSFAQPAWACHTLDYRPQTERWPGFCPGRRERFLQGPGQAGWADGHGPAKGPHYL